MKEIGGYMDMEHYFGNEFHNNCIRLNSARNALKYLIKAKKIKEIYLPLLLCDSIYNACKEEKVIINFYNIDKNLKPIINNLDKESYVYLINYYGQFNNNYIINIKKEYPNLIVDNVQAFYQKPIKNIDTIYSCRKYFGVSDGAYLYTNSKLNEDIEIDKSSDRMDYILKRFEENANDHYYLFQKNEEQFEKYEIKYMSKITQNILKSIDYKKVKKIRKKNYLYLSDNLSLINELKVNNSGDYMYPLYIKNGNIIRKKLQESKIYIPKLWPYFKKDSKLNESFEIDLADNIIPIPCDQRYSIDDMEKIVSKIKEYMIDLS